MQRVVGCKLLEFQSLLGWHVHSTESIDHASSPQIAADATALWLPPSRTASLAALGCEARRFFESGAHTTRHDTEQSTGIEHALWIVNATLLSPLSA